MKLEPLRGTIIHDRHFKASGGELQVSSSKRGKLAPQVTITATDLRNVAFLLVSLLRYLEGVWMMDSFAEKRLRRALDEVAHLHGLSSLGQQPPRFLTVRLTVEDTDPIQFDLARIYEDATAPRPEQDVMFDLQIIVVSRDGARVAAYLVPWDRLDKFSRQFHKTRAGLAAYGNNPSL